MDQGTDNHCDLELHYHGYPSVSGDHNLRAPEEHITVLPIFIMKLRMEFLLGFKRDARRPTFGYGNSWLV